MHYKANCPKCKNSFPVEITALQTLMGCLEGIRSSETAKDLSPELQVNLAVSLFINISKDKITEKIQSFRR